MKLYIADTTRIKIISKTEKVIHEVFVAVGYNLSLRLTFASQKLGIITMR